MLKYLRIVQQLTNLNNSELDQEGLQKLHIALVPEKACGVISFHFLVKGQRLITTKA